MKFTNKAAFMKDVERKLRAALDREVLPVFKGVVMEATKALVEGDFRYAGTPEWSGNAAANWWPSIGAPASEFNAYFTDPKWPGPASEYSAQNPRTEATAMSIARVDAFLRSMTAAPSGSVWITNTAPYLEDYQPYGDGALFRLENLYPLSAMRAVAMMNDRINNADVAQVKAWKAGYAQ